MKFAPILVPAPCWGSIAPQPGVCAVWCCPAQSYLAQLSLWSQRDLEASTLAWKWMRRGQVAEQDIALDHALVDSEISRQEFCKGLQRVWAGSAFSALHGQVLVLGSTWGKDDSKCWQTYVKKFAYCHGPFQELEMQESCRFSPLLGFGDSVGTHLKASQECLEWWYF